MQNLKKILEGHATWLIDNLMGVRADLSDADLSRADLSRANLRDANLRGANLTGANLRGANLTGANLRDANLRDANLRDADLRDADLMYANLSGANLTSANLRGANLTDANLTGANLPLSLSFVLDNELLKKVAIAALSNKSALQMNDWHTCDTTHCIAGWAIHLHPDGKRLVENSSEYLAGRLLLGDEVANHFFDSNKDAIAYLVQFA